MRRLSGSLFLPLARGYARPAGGPAPSPRAGRPTPGHAAAARAGLAFQRLELVFGVGAHFLGHAALGRQRFLTIGPHGSPWTPDAARREAKKLLGQVAAERDPAEAKAQARLEATDTLGKITIDYLKAVQPMQRPATHSEIKRYLTKAWKPLHPVSVFSITRRQITGRVAKIAEAHGDVSATRARAALCTLFNWAIAEGYEIAANPVLGSNRPAQPKSRDRVLSDAELAEIWRACGDDDYGRIVRLLILTGQRRDEVGGMQWPELDTVAGTWILPGTRTKNHREHSLPLSPATLALLPARRNDRDHVFGDGPRREGDTPRGFGGWSKSKAALDALMLAARQEDDADAKPLPAWTIHDVRRSVATGMADRLGVLPHIVEAVLNHISGHRAGVAGVYNRARYEVEMRDALKRWSEHVAVLVRPTAPIRPKSIRIVRI